MFSPHLTKPGRSRHCPFTCQTCVVPQKMGILVEKTSRRAHPSPTSTGKSGSSGSSFRDFPAPDPAIHIGCAAETGKSGSIRQITARPWGHLVLIFQEILNREIVPWFPNSKPKPIQTMGSGGMRTREVPKQTSQTSRLPGVSRGSFLGSPDKPNDRLNFPTSQFGPRPKLLSRSSILNCRSEPHTYWLKEPARGSAGG